MEDEKLLLSVEIQKLFGSGAEGGCGKPRPTATAPSSLATYEL